MAIVRGPLNSSEIPEAQPVAGVYNVTPPAPQDTQGCALQVDANGNLKVVNEAGGVASIVQIEDTAGNPLTSTAGALNVNVTGGTVIATNPSVGLTGAAAPTSATEIGIVVGGNLVNVSAANPIPVTGAFSTGTLTNNNAAPVADNQGVLPALANAANPTWVEGNQVLLSEDLSGNLRTITASGSTTAVTGNVTVVQPTGTNLHVVVDSGSTTSASGTLTNNNAAPAANNMGVLPAVAETAYTTVTYTTGDQVLPVTDLHGALNEDLQAWAGTALGTPTAFGTTPGAVVAGSVNASLFAGTTALTATSTFLNVQIKGSVLLGVSGGLTNDNAIPAANNIGVLPAVANAAAPTWLEGAQVLLSEDLSGNLRTITGSGSTTAVTGTVAVDGALTNNNAAPAATNIGVLPAIAETAYTTVTYTTGDQVLPVTDLHGALNEDLQAVAGVQLGATAVTAYGTTPAAANVPGVNAFITNTPAVTLASTTITGTVAVDGALTNNNAAPTATLQGVLPAIAETAYTTATYTTGDMVLPVTDLHGALNEDLQAVAGVALGPTAVTNFGTAPAAAAVPGVNSSVFAGTTGITATGSSLNVNITGGGSTGSLTNNNAAPTSTNLGVLPAIAETAYTTVTYTTGNQVLPVTDLHGALNQDLQAVAGVALGATAVTAYGTAPAAANVPGVNAFITNTPAVTLSTGIAPAGFTGTSLNVDVTNTVPVSGALTNNNAAPAATNLGVLPALANAANPTWTEGDQVLLSEDLAGRLRIMGQVASGSNNAGNPVVIGGYNTGTSQVVTPVGVSLTGTICIGASLLGGDAEPVYVSGIFSAGLGGTTYLAVAQSAFNGTTYDRVRTAGIGNAVAATGIQANAAYGEYLSTAPAPTTGQYSALQTDYKGSLFVKPIRRSETVSQATACSTTAATTVLAAQAAGVFADISNLVMTVLAVAVDVNFTVTLSDGTISYVYNLNTGGVTTPSPGSQIAINFNPPIPATTAATAWTLTMSVAETVNVNIVAVLQKAS